MKKVQQLVARLPKTGSGLQQKIALSLWNVGPNCRVLLYLGVWNLKKVWLCCHLSCSGSWKLVAEAHEQNEVSEVTSVEEYLILGHV